MEASILNKKIELIQWLSTLEDESVVEELLAFRDGRTKDWWESISD